MIEAGYDVWFGNFRGNHDSRWAGERVYWLGREHSTMDPDRDNDYWQFSWDEMATIDLPTMLNYVLEHTAKEKVLP
jgi:lysosomal acid lipase/cholesteryl ester hydrolase